MSTSVLIKSFNFVFDISGLLTDFFLRHIRNNLSLIVFPDFAREIALRLPKNMFIYYYFYRSKTLSNHLKYADSKQLSSSIFFPRYQYRKSHILLLVFFLSAIKRFLSPYLPSKSSVCFQLSA